MEAVPSGGFLKEFTLIADRAVEEKERFLIQRKNGRHVVLLSMEDYNGLLREIYAKTEPRESGTCCRNGTEAMNGE